MVLNAKRDNIMSYNLNQDLKNIANRVIDKIPNKDPEKFGSVIIILTVISIILTLIRIWQGCNKSKLDALSKNQRHDYFGQDVKNISIKKTWYTKMVVKKAIRKELSKEEYKEYGVPLMNAIFQTGTNLTQNEINTLVEAANV